MPRSLAALRAVPNIGVYVGISLVVAGGALVLLAWGQTAHLNSVANQIPYMIGTGFSGLGLVIIGLATTSLSAHSRDARIRQRQAERMLAMLTELRHTIEGDSE